MKSNLIDPKVSVVMSIYNEEKFLDECISSILNQTFKNFEFIIVNNGSTDNSVSIIRDYIKKDRRIKLINIKKNPGDSAINKGTSKAVNKGLKLARGEYIASFCGDDYSYPKRLEIQSKYLDSHPNIFLVGTSAVYMNDNGKEVRRFRKYDDFKIISWRLRKSCCLIYPSLMFRNGDVSLDLNIDSNDYNFYFDLIKRRENLTNIPDFLIKHRVHSGSMSIYDSKRYDKSRDEIIEKFSKLPDKRTLLEKIYFPIKLILHHLKTRNEKKEIKSIS